MRQHSILVPPLLALVLFAVSCGGGGYYTAGYTTTYATYSRVAPPAPYVEVRPYAPGPDYAWVNGYWHWDGSQYVWMRGRWEPVPATGYSWVPHGWIRDRGVYRFHPGRWVRGRPPHVAFVHPAPRYRTGPQYYVVPHSSVLRHRHARVPQQYYYRPDYRYGGRVRIR